MDEVVYVNAADFAALREELRKMEEATTTPLAFESKMLKLYERFSYVQKTGTNTHFKYRFMQESVMKRKLNEACRELGLILDAVRVSPVGECTGKTAVVAVELIIRDAASAAKVTLQGIGGGMDTGDKAPCKAMVSAFKYALACGLAVETGDDPEDDAKTDEAAADEVRACIAAATTRPALELVKPRIAALKGHDEFDALKEAFKARAEELSK